MTVTPLFSGYVGALGALPHLMFSLCFSQNWFCHDI